MRKVIEYKISRTGLQTIQLPKYYTILDVLEIKNKPTLIVLVDDIYPLVDVNLYTINDGQDLTTLPFISSKMYIGTFLSPNNKNAKILFG